MKATAKAHANIALVKYWGKRCLKYNLPSASSLSLTLDGLDTTTTVSFGHSSEDMLRIDGVDLGPGALGKVLAVVDPVRAAAGITAPVCVESTNNFPTGAGLASSASGLAAVALAAVNAAQLDWPLQKISALARRGSGSASRSLYGGYVEWMRGEREDGEDSYAIPVADASHWDLRVVVAVVSAGKKPVGSTDGMMHTQRTSPYHQAFLDSVPGDISSAKEAISKRDLALLRQVTERSCLRMHADMQAADPPLVYLQPSSWEVISTVRRLQNDGVPAFFTADAGPNIKVFCEPDAVPTVREALMDLRVVQKLVVARPGAGATVVDAP